MDDSIKSLDKQIAASKSYYRDFTSRIYTTTIGPFKGREIRAGYRVQGKPCALRVFLWQSNDCTFYVSMHCYEQYRDDAKQEQDEAIKSIEFR